MTATSNIPRYEASVPLQKEFVANNDFCGDNIFTQVKRSGNVCLYKRSRFNGTTVSYEVFTVKLVKAGAPLPNGKKVEKDYEQYPGKSAFGKTAWAPVSLVRAEERFDELLGNKTSNNDAAPMSEPEDSPKKEVVAATPVTLTVLIPDGEFSRVQFAELNNMPVENSNKAYQTLRELVDTGIIKEARRVSEGKRGRPSVLYVKV